MAHGNVRKYSRVWCELCMSGATCHVQSYLRVGIFPSFPNQLTTSILCHTDGTDWRNWAHTVSNTTAPLIYKLGCNAQLHTNTKRRVHFSSDKAITYHVQLDCALCLIDLQKVMCLIEKHKVMSGDVRSANTSIHVSEISVAHNVRAHELQY